MCQSIGIIISLPFISITIAGELNDSKNIKGTKKKSGSLGSELSSTLNRTSSSSSSGKSSSIKHLFSNVKIFILIPVYFFYCKGILCFFIEFFSLSQMSFCKFARRSDIPNLHKIFVFCLSYASAYTLYYPDKTFARLNENKIKNTRYVNTNRRDPVCCDNHVVSSFIDFIISIFPIF